MVNGLKIMKIIKNNFDYSDIQLTFFKKEKVCKSPHNEMINNVIEFMGEGTYIYWCGRLKRYKKNPSQIHDAIKLSKSKNNPQKYFNAMLKHKWINT